MKKVLKRIWIWPIILVAVLLFSPISCARSGTTVKLNYYDMHVTLNREEAARVANILNCNIYDSILFSGVPSCGFGGDITIKVGGRTFLLPEDHCNTVQDKGNWRFFDISKEEMAYIHSLFNKYGEEHGVSVHYP